MDIFDKVEYLCAGTTGLDRHVGEWAASGGLSNVGDSGLGNGPDASGKSLCRKISGLGGSLGTYPDCNPGRGSLRCALVHAVSLPEFTVRYAIESTMPTVRIGWDTHDSEHIMANHS